MCVCGGGGIGWEQKVKEWRHADVRVYTMWRREKGRQGKEEEARGDGGGRRLLEKRSSLK